MNVNSEIRCLCLIAFYSYIKGLIWKEKPMNMINMAMPLHVIVLNHIELIFWKSNMNVFIVLKSLYITFI